MTSTDLSCWLYKALNMLSPTLEDVDWYGMFLLFLSSILQVCLVLVLSPSLGTRKHPMKWAARLGRHEKPLRRLSEAPAASCGILLLSTEPLTGTDFLYELDWCFACTEPGKQVSAVSFCISFLRVFLFSCLSPVGMFHILIKPCPQCLFRGHLC